MTDGSELLMANKGKVAVAAGYRKIEFREHELPEVRAGGILTKIRLANICGSDVKAYVSNGTAPGLGLGHEFVAEILELGAGVTKDYADVPVKVGDRIVLPYFLSCGECNPCIKGDYQNCTHAYDHMPQRWDEWPYFGNAFGTHFYVHPGHKFYKVPDNLDDKIVVGANCAVSQVYGAIDKQLDVNDHDTVVIQGLGGLGLYATAICRERGAKVIAIGKRKNRIEMAKRFGACVVIDVDKHPTVEERVALIQQLTGGKGATKCIEVAGDVDAENEGIQHLGLYGKYAIIGNNTPGHLGSFDPGMVCRRAQTLYGILRYDYPVLKKSIDFLAATVDKYPYEELCPVPYPLDDIQEIMEKAANKEIVRPCLKP